MAMKCYQGAAARGDLRARSCLAHGYYQGVGVAKDIQKSLQEFKIGADQGHLVSQLRLAGCYIHEGGPENEKLAAHYLKMAADSGHAETQYHIGVYYLYGVLGLPKDQNLAQEYIDKAEKQGYTRENYHKDSFENYKRSADSGMNPKSVSRPPSPRSSFLVFPNQLVLTISCFRFPWRSTSTWFFFLLLSTKTVSSSHLSPSSLTGSWLTPNLGDLMGKYLVGFYYHHGYHVSKNEKTAFRYYLSAAKEIPDAQYFCGLFHFDGIGGAKKNRKRAFHYFRMKEAQTLPETQHMIGFCYGEGLGVQKNEKEMVKWMKKAANQGYLESMIQLGVCYDRGIGVEPDEKLAVQYAKIVTQRLGGNTIRVRLVGVSRLLEE
jgi:TPR repeat protein